MPGQLSSQFIGDGSGVDTGLANELRRHRLRFIARTLRVESSASR